MKQVLGFEDLKFPHKVYKLNKAIHGLRQASRAWNQRIDRFLATHKLKQNSADACIYYSDTQNQLIIIMFVDDGLCCCQDARRIDHVLMSMKDIFKTKINDQTYTWVYKSNVTV